MNLASILPHMLVSTSRMATVDVSGTLTFVPARGGTRLRWSWTVRPRGPARLLAPLFVLIGGRQERRTWTRLRDHLETPAAVTDAGARQP